MILFDALGMPSSAEFGGEPGFKDLLGQGFADEAGAQGEQVGVIVLAAIGGGGEVVAHAGAHAGDLVGGHAGADPGAVDHHPSQALPVETSSATAWAKSG